MRPVVVNPDEGVVETIGTIDKSDTARKNLLIFEKNPPRRFKISSPTNWILSVLELNRNPGSHPQSSSLVV